MSSLLAKLCLMGSNRHVSQTEDFWYDAEWCGGSGAFGCCRIRAVKWVSGVVQSVSNCGRITDEGVRSLCTSTAITDNLTVLELDSCMQITDDCLAHITACHRLQRLEVFDNRQITRPAVEHYMVCVMSSFCHF